MFFDKQQKSTGKFIVYSNYGLQSHIVMNNYGVVFSCNPLTVLGCAKVFYDKNDAELAKDNFYDKVAEVQFIAKWENEFISATAECIL